MTASCPSVVLLDSVTVQQAHAASAGTFSGGGGQQVVLSVAPPTAERVVGALAFAGAVIRAGILSGPPAGPPAALPALDGCGGTSSAPSR